MAEKYCSKCLIRRDWRDNFCCECGEPLSLIPPLSCPTCKRTLDRVDKFCPSCGMKVKGAVNG